VPDFELVEVPVGLGPVDDVVPAFVVEYVKLVEYSVVLFPAV
jgi:hypothetical protein